MAEGRTSGQPLENSLGARQDALAVLLSSSEGGLKDAQKAARVAVLINKVESPSQLAAARRVAQCILREPRVERVAIGALRGGPSASADWEVWPQVDAPQRDA